MTRFIPEGGLENFDRQKHQTTHGRDSGRWEMRSGQLVIAWGDGGVHAGTLTMRPDGIEFYGKRYTKPISAPLSAIAGRWEAARGTAIAGGSGINVVSALVIQPDGRYEWRSTTGGTVAGRAAASDVTLSGKMEVRESTIIFTPDKGPATSHTFLPAAGSPVTAFSMDANMFTRSE